MPEIPLTLLKEKIIKTDIVIHLLAQKNEKIAQIREKITMLYHKYVKKVKECEELQLKIDMCRMEHEPLNINLKELLQKYEDLQEQYQTLTNSSEIRYQNKCMELESQIKKYEDLLHQKQRCNSCQELSNKHETMTRKYDKINRQLQSLREQYQSSQSDLKTLQSNNSQMENQYLNQLKVVKEAHANEITSLQNVIASVKLSESNLKREILQLTHRVTTLDHQLGSLDSIEVNDCQVNDGDESANDDDDDDDMEEWEKIDLLKLKYVPPLLSPIVSPLENVTFTEIRGNQYINDSRSLKDANIEKTFISTDTIEDHSKYNDNLAGSINESCDNKNNYLKESNDWQVPLTKKLTLPEDHLPVNSEMLEDSYCRNDSNKNINEKTANDLVISQDQMELQTIEDNCNDNLECKLGTSLHDEGITNSKLNNTYSNDIKTSSSSIDISGNSTTHLYKILCMQYSDYMGTIIEHKSPKHTPVSKVNDLMGFVENDKVTNSKNKRIKYIEKHTNSLREDITRNKVDEELHKNNELPADLEVNLLHNVLVPCDVYTQSKETFREQNINRGSCIIQNGKLKNTVSLNSNFSNLIEECIYVNNVSTNTLHNSLTCQGESRRYLSRTALNGDFLGFVKKIDVETNVRKQQVRIVRRRMVWRKMKAELFYSLVKYFNRKFKSNQMSTIKAKTKNYTSRSKSMRKLRMLRWKKIRELYLSSTDTDSDQSKNLVLRRRSKFKTKLEAKMYRKPNETLSDISEDEYALRKIIKEERNYRRLISNHKDLEDFYHMSTENVITDNIADQTKENAQSNSNEPPGNSTLENVLVDTDRDDVHSGDSGYIKSDSDFNINENCKRKQTDELDDNDGYSNNKRRVFPYSLNHIRGTDPSIGENTVNNSENEIEINGISRTDVFDVSSEQLNNECITDVNKKCDKINHVTKVRKECVTAEICSLLQGDSSSDGNEFVNVNKLEKNSHTSEDISQGSWFSDCENASSANDDLVKTSNLSDSVVIQNSPVQNKQRIARSIPKLKKIKTRSSGRTVVEQLLPIPELQTVSEDKDPLHARLREEGLKVHDHIRKDNEIRTSYKRSNSLRNRHKLLQKDSNPAEVSNSTSKEKLDIVPVKPKKLQEEKAKALLKQVLTFPEKSAIIDEVAATFSTQDNIYISRIIILELSLDINRADTKYTPPAPVLTETQRILLGFLVKLDQVTPGLLDVFLIEAEEYLFKSKKLQCIENVTRLYLAVCKVHRKIHRMRRMVCDAFYFMGDFSIPFLFTVLSTWIEVLPLQSDIQGELMVKVIIEIIKQKKCIAPGFNLTPLKCLLKAYYGYDMEENCVDNIFLELLHKYKETQSKSFEYAIRVLCKNMAATWTTSKVEEHMKPLVANTDNVLLKKNISKLMETISRKDDM